VGRTVSVRCVWELIFGDKAQLLLPLLPDAAADTCTHKHTHIYTHKHVAQW